MIEHEIKVHDVRRRCWKCREVFWLKAIDGRPFKFKCWSCGEQLMIRIELYDTPEGMAEYKAKLLESVNRTLARWDKQPGHPEKLKAILSEILDVPECCIRDPETHLGMLKDEWSFTIYMPHPDLKLGCRFKISPPKES